jgi:hypothetical protein
MVGYPAQFGDSFAIISVLNSQPIARDGSALPEGATFFDDGYQFRVSYVGGDGNDLTLTIVPEPTSIMPLVAGIGAMLRRRRSRL